MPAEDPPATPEPQWLTDQERDTWLEVSTIALQLPGVLDSQLQRDADLNLFEYLVLSWLSMAPDRQVRMSELADLVRGSMSRLSNVVKRLEHRGFVRRLSDPENGRYTLASLTDAGWDKVVCAAPGHVRAVRQFVLDPLTVPQVAELQQIGGRIAEVIRNRPAEDQAGGESGDDGTC